jgi:precorrin-6B methylase 1
MIRRVAPALFALGVSACGHDGSVRLEGKWKGKSAEGVTPEAQSAANAFATETEIDVKGDEITVITSHERQSGTYRVVHEDRSQVTIVTDKDGPNDAQTFTLVDDKTLRWSVLEGKTITFTRGK